VALIALPAGCGTTSSATSQNATRNAGRHSRALPVAFQVVARWSARSLGLAGPAAVAIGPDGDLYVIDSAQHVTVISPSGKVLRRWGKPGSGPGEFELTPEDPTDPMYVNGKIAVSRSGLRVRQRTTATHASRCSPELARFIRQFGGRGTGPGQFLYPFDIAVDPAGGVYVADDQKRRRDPEVLPHRPVHLADRRQQLRPTGDLAGTTTFSRWTATGALWRSPTTRAT